MNKIFEFDKQDFIKFVSNSYKSDPNYNSNLDMEHIIKITKRESINGVEKTITLKIDKRKRKLRVKIPKGIKNGQSILFIGEGRKQNNKYGNLIITIKIK